MISNSFLEKNYPKRSNYVLKATHKTDYWFGLEYARIQHYDEITNGRFNIVIYSSSDAEGDFYAIPFALIRSVLQENSLIKSKTRRRWVGNIRYHILKFRNSETKINLTDFFGLADTSPALSSEILNEYAIENKLIEVNSRVKQSYFRKQILKNYHNKCCISGISTPSILIASHIIPWSHRINTRLDPQNGICLSVLFDKLFDQGLMTFNVDYEVCFTPSLISDNTLWNTVRFYQGQRIFLPDKFYPKQEYLRYHRESIFCSS